MNNKRTVVFLLESLKSNKTIETIVFRVKQIKLI